MVDSINKTKSIFDAAEIAIWEQDFSSVKSMLSELKGRGISDLKEYLRQNTSVAWDLAKAARTVEVNDATLKIFKASSAEDLAGSIHLTFTTATLRSFINLVCAIWHGEKSFKEQVSIKAVDGNDLEVLLSVTLPHTDEEYKRVPVCIIDVTRSTHLYRELLKSEKKYADIIESIPDVYYRTDAKGIITAISPAAFQVIGIPAENLIGLNMADFYMHPEDREVLLEQLMEKPGEAVIFESHLKHKDGHSVYVSTKTRFVLDTTGKPIGVEGIARDITDHKEMTEQLRRSERRLKTTLQAAPVILFALDAEGKITLSEGKGLESLGMKPGGLVGKSVFEVYDDPIVIENVNKALNNQHVVYETALDGNSYRTTLTPISEDDNLKGVIGVSSVITKLKEAEESLRVSEERYKAIVEALGQSDHGLFVVDSDYRIEYMNDIMQEWFGDLHGHICFDSTAKRDNPCEYCQLPKVISEGKTVRYSPVVGDQYFDIIATPIPDGKGGVSKLEIITNVTEEKKAEAFLKKSEETYRQLFLDSQAVELLVDPENGKIVDANHTAANFYGYPLEVLKTMKVSQINTLPEKMLLKELGSAHQKQRNHFEFMHRLASGELRNVDVHAGPLEIDGKELVHSIIIDITEQKYAQETVSTLYKVVEQSPDSVIITDPEGNIEYVNPFFEQVTGYSENEVIGKNPRFLKSNQTPPDRYEDLWKTITNGEIWRGELVNKTKSGELLWEFASISPVYDERGNCTHYVAIKENITEKKRQEETILRQAYFDNVTDLPNRVLAIDRLSQGIKEAHRNAENVALLFIDLDDFKKVNDSLGHEKGDQLLIMAASRLRSCVREGDTVARHGGDEFLVILNGLKNPMDAETIAEKILSVMTEPFILNGMEIVVTASIGLAVYPNDGETPSLLLRNADTAMYQAKNEGRNTYHFFAKLLNDEAVERLAMERSLQLALENNEFFLEYQPQMDTRTGKCTGAEALIRWQNPQHGRIPPDKFIPMAEQLGLINPIGEWALRTACKQAKTWIDQGAEDFKMSVNVSPRQFRDYAVLGAIDFALGESKLPPKYLEVEVTEGLMVRNRTESKNILDKLTELGVSISMDDFGTGYSSLSYIKDFPFDKLKIDRAFVFGVENDPENQALVTAVTAMAKALGLKVVAEGVENTEQKDFVSDQGCDLIQGYYYSKPLSADDFTQLLKDNK